MAIAPGTRERSVLLSNIDWETYERILAAHEDASSPRFTYDRGDLEITMPLPQHERYNRALQLVVSVAVAQLGGRVLSLGSSTFRREDLDRGFEPDSAFYVRNIERVRGRKRIDLRTDPPPDIVAEIEVTRPAVPRLPLYAEFGVPEVWQYDGQSVSILVLREGHYEAAPRSHALPALTASALTLLLDRNEEMDDSELIRRVQEWARDRQSDRAT